MTDAGPARPLRYAAPFALGWTLVAAGVGATWASGAPVGYEYGGSPVHAGTVGAVLAVVALAGAGPAAAMTRAGRPAAARPGRPAGYVVAGFALLFAATLLVLGPGRLLLDVLQLPLGVVPAPAGLAVRLLALAGGVAWGAAGIVHLRRAGGRCLRCGRARHGDDGPRTRWRARAILAATFAPVPYSLQRLCWAVGLPVGIPAADLQTIHHDLGGYGRIGLLVLVLLSEGGAFLVHGLGRPWGSTVPGWVPRLGGRRIPPRAAIGPATVVALVLTGLTGFIAQSDLDGATPDPWLAHLTAFDLALGEGLMLLIMAWGPLIGLATYAYHLDRRGPCPAAPALTAPAAGRSRSRTTAPGRRRGTRGGGTYQGPARRPAPGRT